MRTLYLATVVTCSLASASHAQMANQMTQDQLMAFTANGAVFQLGGPGQGYSGSFTIEAGGRGYGQATLDSGEVLTFDGTWTVRDGMLCRTWNADGSDGEVCETWVLTSGRSADVYVGDRKIGVNSC